jgi:hypothetical protein
LTSGAGCFTYSGIADLSGHTGVIALAAVIGVGLQIDTLGISIHFADILTGRAVSCADALIADLSAGTCLVALATVIVIRLQVYT